MDQTRVKRTRKRLHPIAAWTWVGAFFCMGVQQVQAQEVVTPERAKALVRMVRQDCGSCHGMRLTGGLGPALTPAAVAHIPPESLAATIYHGRPGTPMPPWRALLSARDADWIAQQLIAGFPNEDTPSKP